MAGDDLVTIGLTVETDVLAQKLKNDGIFNNMNDAYRFGIAYAIANNNIAPDGLRYETKYNMSSVDPDGTLRGLVSELYPQLNAKPSAIIQRLAEWGISEIGHLHENDKLNFTEIFKVVNRSR